MALQTNSSKNDTTVTIGGKTYTLSGYESENYLQEVASYLNTKIAEIRNDRELQKLPFEMRNVLLQLNIADDYFKARSEADKVHVRMGEKDQNLSDDEAGICRKEEPQSGSAAAGGPGQDRAAGAAGPCRQPQRVQI